MVLRYTMLHFRNQASRVHTSPKGPSRMKYAGMLCASIASMMSVIAQAQGASAGLGVPALEVREVVSLGWSAKRQVLAVSVFNDHRDRIGVVDDIVILPDMAMSYAVFFFKNR